MAIGSKKDVVSGPQMSRTIRSGLNTEKVRETPESGMTRLRGQIRRLPEVHLEKAEQAEMNNFLNYHSSL